MQQEAILFDSKPNPERSPDRLRTIAALKGLQCAPLESCFVLDIGCGTGMDLLCHALLAPQSTFHGIDYSKEHLAVGNSLIKDLGLPNISLSLADILNFDPKPESYDYIICHGVFSWVTKEVQSAIFKLCNKALKKNGVAYVSFNAQPGWAVRSTIRKFLSLFDVETTSAFERVEKARKNMQAIIARLEDSQTAYTQQLYAEVLSCSNQSSAFIYHELLSPVSRSFYLDEFCSFAANHQLQYLGDGRPSRMRIQNDELEDKNFRSAISLNEYDSVMQEQVWDILLPPSIRGCLLCHDSVELSEGVQTDVFAQSHYTSTLVPLAPTPRIDDTSIEIFTDPREYTFEISDPTLKALLFTLSERWPQAISWQELCTAIRAHVPESSAAKIKALLSEYFMTNLIDAYLTAPSIASEISVTPQVFSLARAQVQMGYDWVSNSRFEYISISDLDEKIIPLLDGTNTTENILEKLVTAIESGEFEVAIKEKEKEALPMAELLKEQLEYSLALYFESALLVA